MQEYQSQDITKLAKALLSVQKTLQPATKDAVNPFAKNKYASLNSVMEVCREPLLSNGIWLCQYPVPVENAVQSEFGQGYSLGLVTKLTHAESGQWQSSLTVIPLSKADPQAMGSAITYARRYSLSAMLGIVTEEDTDGISPKQNQQAKRSSQAQTSQKKQVSNKAEESKLPILNGVIYDSFEGKDEQGNTREVITASGNTIPHKDELIKAGFKWNPNKKIWWQYGI